MFLLKPVNKMDNSKYASRTKRLLNWIIDTLIIALLWFGIILFTSEFLINIGLQDWIAKVNSFKISFSVIAVMFLYYLIMEGFFKTSLGKLITKTNLTTVSGEELSFYPVFIRTICRLIPLEPLSFFSKEAIGWHDSLSKTRVIEMKISQKSNG